MPPFGSGKNIPQLHTSVDPLRVVSSGTLGERSTEFLRVARHWWRPRSRDGL
jgi:hypothetical protein